MATRQLLAMGPSAVWDDPWMVLQPNFWGSAEPHFVPADSMGATSGTRPWIGYWRHYPDVRPPARLEKPMRRHDICGRCTSPLLTGSLAHAAADERHRHACRPRRPPPRMQHRAKDSRMSAAQYGCGRIYSVRAIVDWRMGPMGLPLSARLPDRLYYACRPGPLGYGQCACWPYLPYWQTSAHRSARAGFRHSAACAQSPR